MNAIRIGLVDDHTLFREGIVRILKEDTSLHIRIEASSGKELLDKMVRTKVDMVFTDISMPEMDGIEVTRLIRRDFKEVPVVGLSMLGQQHYIQEIMDAGASGFVMKSALPTEMVEAVKQAVKGKTFFCKETTNVLFKELGRTKGPNLSARELEVLRLIFEEKTETEIADHLGVSPKTIHNDIKGLKEKLEVKNNVGLAKWVITNGIR